MAASTLSTVAFIYKRLYAGRPIGDSAAREHATYSMINKKAGFTGTSFYYPVRYGNPQGVSSTFYSVASAQVGGAVQAVGGSKGVQFAATRKAKYGYITLDGESMAAAEDNEGAFMDLVTTETDGVINELVDSLAFDLFRDGTGVRGRRASISTNTITLTSADDARNFKVGMTIVASSTTAAGGLRVGSSVITAVDEQAGTITMTLAANITAFADNDYIFRVGDVGACCEGLAALFPLTAPVAGSDSFRGVDRGVDPPRLAGSRIDDTGTVAEENLGLLAVEISKRNKKATHGILNPIKFYEVVRRTNAKVIYEGGGESATIGFEHINLATPAGTIKLYSDADCPTTRGYVLNMSTLYAKHLKALPHIVQDDGKDSLRLTTEDSIEARVRCWWNLICTDPAANGVCSFA